MRLGVLHRLDQLGDDMWRGRPVGVAHAEVDDVATRGAGLCLQRVDFGKDIGRQTLDAVELFGHGGQHGLSAKSQWVYLSRAIARDRAILIAVLAAKLALA